MPDDDQPEIPAIPAQSVNSAGTIPGTAAWTHRPTWPDHRPATDRTVLREGVAIARTYRHEHGPDAGRWGWFGRCDGPGNTGTADSLKDALTAVRSAVEGRHAAQKSEDSPGTVHPQLI